MAKNVIINGVTYQSVPSVDIPTAEGTDASFYDTSDATLDNANKMLSGVSAYANGTKYVGSIQSQNAQTITPSTSTQTVNSGVYLAGAITVEGDVNLVSTNILAGKSIFGVDGEVTLPTISQDPVTKILSIS